MPFLYRYAAIVGINKDISLGTIVSTIGSGGTNANIMFFTGMFFPLFLRFTYVQKMEKIYLLFKNQFPFFKGNANTDADALTGKFLRLHSSSQPRIPYSSGEKVDTDVTTASLRRYDIRILVCVCNLYHYNNFFYCKS